MGKTWKDKAGKDKDLSFKFVKKAQNKKENGKDKSFKRKDKRDNEYFE